MAAACTTAFLQVLETKHFIAGDASDATGVCCRFVSVEIARTSLCKMTV
jgi:hypothetical protein